MIFESITYLYNTTAQSSSWVDFFRDIISGAIGGGIGAGLLYEFYIIRKEMKKEECSKKAACTSALLKTQTDLMLQMQALAGLKQICNSILTAKIGSLIIGELLKNISGIDAKIQMLQSKLPGQPYNPSDLNKIVNYIITEPLRNHNTSLPYELFQIQEITLTDLSIVNEAECAVYFQNVSSCNKKYNEIISLIDRNNNLRDKILFQPQHSSLTIDNMLLVIASNVELAFQLEMVIKIAIQKMYSSFEKAGNYINSIGLAKPIQAAIDESGDVIFNEEKNEI
ncbi:MAG: hypothetical protein LRY67_07155 [Gammaproteobacteria bacterium]|nr:hypothetical protein [Gammaproteobacteria bacterium]MCD8543236.1 hypothetical protein [Gammaproteobacteria bacterium]